MRHAARSILAVSILLSLFCTFPARSIAQDALGAVEEGNAAYQKEQYSVARDRYLDGIHGGVDNGHVWYNLGNAYFRLGERGHAIASYRRALELVPRDPDIQANLAFARQRVTESASGEVDSVAFDRRVLSVLPPLSDEEWRSLFLIGYTAGWLMLIAAAARQSNRLRSFGAGILVVSLLPGIAGYATGRDLSGARRLSFLRESSHPAVVAQKEAEVFAGDGKQFQVIAVVHDGAEVMSLEQRPGWVQILLPGDRRGWLPSAALDIVGTPVDALP